MNTSPTSSGLPLHLISSMRRFRTGSSFRFAQKLIHTPYAIAFLSFGKEYLARAFVLFFVGLASAELLIFIKYC